jgi:dimethylglycine catabolism B
MSAPRRLAMLDERRAALETCGYCPKLCRSACPVSEAEASEALIPWGKMTLTWYAARGDVPPDRELSALPWACTGCFGCRERCEHKNPVAETLVAARAEYRERDLVPARAEGLERRLEARRSRAAARARELGAPAAGTALVVGCGYLSGRGREPEEALRVARALLGPVAVLTGCCGVATREAGLPARADAERRALLEEARGRRLVALDAGCALALRADGARTLVELAAERLDHFHPALTGQGPTRWHDPCRLSRGLGLEREPRAILERALGSPPLEFERRGRHGACAGSGGLLPFTMPRTAKAIARDRMAEHERLGGGTIVTGCASSLGWLRAQRAPVLDLVTVMARSLSGG